MFGALWPGLDAQEVPIGSVTNGVQRHVGRPGRSPSCSGSLRLARPGAASRPDKPSGSCARPARAAGRRGAAAGCGRRGCSAALQSAELGWVDDAFDPDVLTIGFARRVPSYKRLTLMLRDPERLSACCSTRERPIQLVIAGKAHPADDGGKALIQQIVQFADDPEVRHRIVFLPNYDMAWPALYRGCDVWLNNPLRPFEACGTSGMKAALNGGLNLSILDGWWDEWYDGSNGWAIPTADGVETRTVATTSRRRALRPDRARGRPPVLRPRPTAFPAAGWRWCATP